MVSPTYPMTTDRLLLRPFVVTDLDALVAIHERPDVTRYLYWEPRSRDEVAAVLATRARQTILHNEGDRLVLAVERRDNGALIGEVHLMWHSALHRQGEIGFVLHPDQQGQGFGQEAAREMLHIGFAELHAHRLIGRCDSRNTASAQLMERLGMRREAHLQQNEWVKGEWTDELIYAMLASEWLG